MQITVKFVNLANEGKKYGSVVDFETNKKYMVKAAMVGRFARGGTYEIIMHPEEWGDTTVNVVDTVKSLQTPQDASGRTIKPNGDRWYMPFVSNCVAHAITADLVGQPANISAWAKAAYDAAQALDALNDDIPQ